MPVGFDRPPSSIDTTERAVVDLAVARYDAIAAVLADLVPAARSIAPLTGAALSPSQCLAVALHPAVGNAYAALLSGRPAFMAPAADILLAVADGTQPSRGVRTCGTSDVWDEALLVALPHLGFSERVCGADVAVRAVEQGFALIRDLWPEAYAWLRLVVRNVIVVEGADNRLVSGSIDRFLGLLYLSLNASPLRTAEMLVHEGSHQFFLLLEQATPVVTADEPEAYSPFVRKPRPLSRVMLGFHAFCNVRTLYAKARGVRPDLNPRTDDEFRDTFMFDELRANFRQQWPVITPSGRSLIEYWMHHE